MKHIPSFKDFLNESEYVSPQEKERKERDAEMKLRENIRKIMDKIKDDPEKADIHKAELDLANAKQTVFDLTKQLRTIKERHEKFKK